MPLKHLQAQIFLLCLGSIADTLALSNCYSAQKGSVAYGSVLFMGVCG